MATRNIVPRATGEGSIGTSAKTWGAVYADDIAVTDNVTAATFTGDLTGDVTGTASGNLALSGGTMTGAISFDVTGEIGYRSETHESTPRPCKQLVVSSTDIDHWLDEGGAKMSLHTYDSTGTNTAENGSFGLLATDGTNSADLVGYPNGDLKWVGKKVSTSNWKIENVTLSLSGTSIKNWGFCKIAYNENVAILSISGLVVGRTISQDTVLCYLPVSSLMPVYAPVHNMSNGSTISHAVITNNYININAVSNATDSHAFSIVFPIA